MPKNNHTHQYLCMRTMLFEHVQSVTETQNMTEVGGDKMPLTGHKIAARHNFEVMSFQQTHKSQKCYQSQNT